MVINFEMQWSLQNIAKLKSSLEHALSVHCNKNGCRKRKGNKKHQMLVQTKFWLILSTKTENNIYSYQKTWTINIFIHFTTQSQGLMRFPHQILLRGHGPTCWSLHPRPPSPRGAAGPRNRDRCRLRSAAVFRLGSRSPRPSHGQNPKERRGENSNRNLGASKVEVLEIVATQKSSLNFRNVVVLRMFWWHRVGWKGHVNQVGSQNALRKLKQNAPSLRKQICVRLGQNRIWNQSPTVGISCNRVRGLTRIWTGKT